MDTISYPKRYLGSWNEPPYSIASTHGQPPDLIRESAPSHMGCKNPEQTENEKQSQKPAWHQPSQKHRLFSRNTLQGRRTALVNAEQHFRSSVLIETPRIACWKYDGTWQLYRSLLGDHMLLFSPRTGYSTQYLRVHLIIFSSTFP